jgi:hypothetical protein
MADESQSRGSKERSPNFPFISLGRALERAQQLYQHEKRGAVPFKVAAEHWRYSPSSSGALQTAAALKHYGLLADEDGGKDRKVRLTDLALRILLDNREDSTERDDLKRQAAVMPPIAAEIYEKYQDGLPSDATLHHFLVLDRGFNPPTAHKVIRILRENEGLARMSSGGIISEVSQTGRDMESTIQASGSQQARARVADALVERQMPRQRVAGTVVGSISRPNCNLTVYAEGAPTQDDIEKLSKLLGIIKDGYPKIEEPTERAEAGVRRLSEKLS